MCSLVARHQLEHPEEYGSLREYAQNFSLSSPLLSGYLEEKDGRVNSPQMSSLLEVGDLDVCMCSNQTNV